MFVGCFLVYGIKAFDGFSGPINGFPLKPILDDEKQLAEIAKKECASCKID